MLAANYGINYMLVWGVDSCGPKEPCIRLGPDSQWLTVTYLSMTECICLLQCAFTPDRSAAHWVRWSVDKCICHCKGWHKM